MTVRPEDTIGSRESDTDLLQRSVSGDSVAFGALIDRHGPAVIRYAWALTSGSDEVDDLAQETFVTAWLKVATIRLVGSSVLPWLLVTCKNHAANLRRANGRRPSIAYSEEIDTAGAAHRRATDLDMEEQLRWVLDDIEQLSPTDRELCEMCLIDGMSYKEASLALGMSAAGVAKRIERSRRRLETLRSLREQE